MLVRILSEVVAAVIKGAELKYLTAVNSDSIMMEKLDPSDEGWASLVLEEEIRVITSESDSIAS